MEKIKTNGIIKVEDYEFTSIEGGFGKDKKSMLVKDIANIHNRKLKHINELINNNRNRFKNNIDIIDLNLVVENDQDLEKFGYTKQSIGAIKREKSKGNFVGIYILSERGYSKLLKLLDDDLAWEIYDMFVDKYFEMRETIKEISKKDLLILDIIKSSTEIETAMAINKYELEYVKPLEIKEEYHDKVISSEGALNIGDIAKEFGKTAIWLNRYLRDKKIQFKKGNKWTLYKEYSDKGYTKLSTYVDTKDVSHINLKWTQKGRKFIHNLLNDDGIFPTEIIENEII